MKRFSPSAFITRHGCQPLVWLFGVSLIATQLRAEKLVTVSSEADKAYAAKRAATNPPAAETYVFAQGKFSPNDRGDSSLEKMTFLKIAQVVAADLKKQNYLPTKELKTADLVIAVHWGATIGIDRGYVQSLIDPSAMFEAYDAIAVAEEAAAADQTLLLRTTGIVEEAVAKFQFEVITLKNRASGGNLQLAASNAKLVGISPPFPTDGSLPVNSTEDDALQSMINEERYFIILVAYDGAALREGKKRQVWTTRMSIRNSGVNFPTAVDRMSNAGALYHGKRLNGVALEVPVTERKAKVEIGESRVVDEPAPKPKR